MRAPGRRSPAALFLVDNKDRSKGLAVQVSLPEGLPPQASDQGLCALPLPRGSAHVHHRGSGEPRAAAQAPVSSQTSSARKLSQEGPGPWLLSETQQEKRTSPTPPATPALGVPGARRTLTSVGGDRLKASRSQSVHQRRGPQQGPQLRSLWATPGPPRHSRGLGLTRSRVE